LEGLFLIDALYQLLDLAGFEGLGEFLLVCHAQVSHRPGSLTTCEVPMYGVEQFAQDLSCELGAIP
jgi:hypothetical protein